MSREMKKTSLPGSESIPSAWETPRLKDNAFFINGDRGKNYPSGEDIKTEGVPFLTSDNIHDTTVDIARDGAKYITEEKYNSMGGAKLELNDLIYCLRGSIGLCAINKELTRGTIASSLVVIRSKHTVVPEFLNYVMNSAVIQQQNENYMNGSCAANLSAASVQNYKMPFPPMREQKVIVSFLETHCSYVDSAISKHRQIIEKLEEYRKAVITQAVTNGLNPNVEMKDSGDSIIPIVPSHWLWTRVKFTVNVVRGGSPRPIEQYIIGEKEDGYNWIKIGDATGGGKFIIATKQRIKPDGLNKTRLVHAGTLLLTNSMSFGHPYFLQIDGCIHDGWLAFSDYKGVLPAFLYYYLMSETTAHQFTTTADGSVVQNLNIDKVRNSHIALPPIVEQKAIVQYLDTVDGKINTAIQHHNQIIEKLQEYKQSLIYNAVTGKIDCTTEA